MIQNNKDAPRPLRRYTNLPVLLDLLAEKRLTLVSPSGWADKNDSFYLEQYKLGLNAKSVLALCLSEAGETYHHWHVFTQGSGGVCIEFRRDALIEAINDEKTVRHGSVEYLPMNRAKPPEFEKLPPGSPDRRLLKHGPKGFTPFGRRAHFLGCGFRL